MQPSIVVAQHADTKESTHNSHGKIIIVYNDATDAISEFTQHLIHTLPDYVVTAVTANKVQNEKENAVLIITAGAQSLENLLRLPSSQLPEIPILASFIAEQTYRLIVQRYSSHKNPVSAIFSDPNMDHQFKLIKNLYKEQALKVAVILSEDTAYKIDEIKKLAKKNEVPIIIETLDAQTSIYKSLNKISSANVLLAIPDNNIFNLENIRNIILTTYRHDQAMIGFSAGMVKAGALATVTSGPEDIAAEIKIWIQKFERTRRAPPARFASFFNVRLNRHVARSLNIEQADPVKLAKSISMQTIQNLSIVKE